MSKLLRTTLLAATIAWLPLAAETAAAGTFEIDPVHSGIAFFIDHLGFSQVIGTAKEFSARSRSTPPTRLTAASTLQ